MGWHLARSLQTYAGLSPDRIHIQFTPEVSNGIMQLFEQAGYSLHTLERFGDGKFCNKLAQWANLRTITAEQILFLDTDMICIADPVPMLPRASIAAKVVDLANPELVLLDEIFARAGFSDRPPMIDVEASEMRTYLGNCNGGFYWVPVSCAERLFAAWRHHALALLRDIEPLRQAGKQNHVDQVAFCMALHETGLPFEQLPSNLNYYMHFPGEHRLRDPARPLAMLHYHSTSLNVLGLLEPAGAVTQDERQAAEAANAQIRSSFCGQLFWDLRYRHFPERGSGVGSREANLLYKRNLLLTQGVEQAASVLDVGCGDLEVLRTLDLRGYVGLDRAPESLTLARAARPDWRFVQMPDNSVEPCDFVICFEVAIHQETDQDYKELIAFLAEKTRVSLIVSGYDADDEHIRRNHMIFFHEPLKQSLVATNRFRRIAEVGRHTDVVIYRCDVL
jgi:hypothetical protein